MKIPLNKILLKIDNINDLNAYQKLGITNFLFPLDGYQIGYNSFTYDKLKDVKGNVYILANRLLTDDDIDKFTNTIIPNYIKGFVIEDIGLYEVLKNSGLEIILFQNHLNNNYLTVNYWLNMFDSLVLNTDLTGKELEVIFNKANKPLVLNTFGYPMIMYSRRTLVSNFYKYQNKEEKKVIETTEPISKMNFIFKENDYGTGVFHNKPYNYTELIDKIDESKVKFYLFDTFNISFDVMKEVIKGNIPLDTFEFIDKKTIYKVKGEKK